LFYVKLINLRINKHQIKKKNTIEIQSIIERQCEKIKLKLLNNTYFCFREEKKNIYKQINKYIYKLIEMSNFNINKKKQKKHTTGAILS